MKQVILITILIFTLISCGKVVKKDDNKLKSNTILYTLPEDTQAILNLKSIESLYKNSKITESEVFGHKMFNKGKYESILKNISINPFDLKDLEKIGVDTKKELGIALNKLVVAENDDDTSANIIFYIPLKDSKKTLSYIDSLFVNGKFKNNKTLVTSYKKENAYIKIFGEKEEESIYFFVKNDYLFAIINPSLPKESLELTKNIINEKTSIKNSKLFTSNIDFSKLNKGVYLYADIKNFIDNNKVMVEKSLKEAGLRLDVIDAYETITSLIELDIKDFIWNLSISINENSKMMKLYNANIEKNIKNTMDKNSTLFLIDKPMLATSSAFTLNSKEIFKSILQIVTEYKLTKASIEEDSKHLDKILDEKIEALNKEFGIDFKKSLIDNFDGNVKYASYDGMGIGATSYNTVFSIGFRDLKTLETTIDKVLTHEYLAPFKSFVSKTNYKGKSLYVLSSAPLQAYIGFNKKELIIASSKNLYDKAINAKKGSGFYKFSKNDLLLNKALNSDLLVYISFSEVIKALNNFKMIIPEKNFNLMVNLMGLGKYFIIDAKFEKSIFQMNYILRMNATKPFFVNIIDYINKTQGK